MTRINVIHPKRLTDQHLLAEYRELPRVFSLARVDYNPVPRYTMGTGHVRFFYSRTGYLAARQSAIIAECLSRGFDIAHREPPTPVPGLSGDWVPSSKDICVNLDRLRSKLIEKPEFYRYYGKIVTEGFYNDISG